MAAEVELAWAAGIIDGEGCLSIAAHRKAAVTQFYSLVLKVTMGHRPTIERLHAVFDLGTIQVVNQRLWNPAWSFYCTTRQAERVLDQVYPYLVTKREEADIARQFLAIEVTPGRRMTDETRERKAALFVAMRDAKPSARFRAV